MGNPISQRNFTCPVTDEPCTDGGCKKGVHCVARGLETASDVAAEERDRERRIRTGRATPDDLGL